MDDDEQARELFSEERSAEVVSLDLEKLAAIDVHVHVHADLHGHLALDDELNAAAARYFKGDPYDPAVPDIAADYRDKKMAAVIFTVDAEAATGQPALSNEEIAEAAAQHPDVLIPFGSIDPHRGIAGVRAARRLVEEHRVRGFKFHPSLQDFLPGDRAAYPLYEELQSLACRRCSTPARPASAPACPAGAASSCAIPTRCCSMTSPPTSPA